MKLNGKFFQIAQILSLLAWLAVALNCATDVNRNKSAGRLLEMSPVILSGLRPDRVPIGWTVFHSEAQWNDFWSQHSFKPAPEFDFEQFTFVVIFLGQKPNPGYSVNIVEAREYPEKVVVHAAQTEPSPDKLYAQVIVYPYAAVLIPKTEKQIQFEMVKEDDSL